MTSFGILILCLVAGYALRRGKVFGPNAHETLGRFVLWISLPALTLVNLRKITWAPSLAFAVLMPWLLFLGAFLFFRALARYRLLPQVDLRTLGALTLVCGLGNTSFLGFPMLEALIGPEAIPPATLLDQLGTFLVLSIPGVALASAASVGSADVRLIAKRVLKFPPFLAVLFGLLTRPLPIPAEILAVAERLGATLTPLALVSVGCQLEFSRTKLRAIRAELAWGLGYKLVLAPVVILAIAHLIDVPHDFIFRMIVLEAAMAPMISAGILADQFGLRTELSSQLVALGILASLVTVPLWNLLVG